MTRWLPKFVGPFRQWMKDQRNRLLARFRAHVALALADNFRQVSEEFKLVTDEFRQFAAAQERYERQIHEMNLFVEALAREILRLQRHLDELAPSLEPTAAEATVAYQGHDSPASQAA
jgi:hypothetical protein